METLLEKLKAIVDNIDVLSDKNTLEDWYKLLNLDSKGGMSSREVSKQLYTNISNTISLKEIVSEKDIKRHKFIKLRDELVYRFVLYNENPIEYLQIISVINDSCRKGCNFFTSIDDIDNWNKAVKYCKHFLNHSPTTFTVKLEKLRKDYPKQFDIASSVKLLIKEGCEIEIKNSDINIVSGLEDVVERLENIIKDIGGVTVIKSLFNHLSLSNLYSERFERYFILRRTNGLTGYEHSPKIPLGYLFNISLKYLNYPKRNAKIKNPQKLLNEIIRLSIIITNGVYGVEQYNMWATLFNKGDKILEHCVETALWDSIFNIQQARYSNAIETTENLFGFISNEYFYSSLGFQKSDFYSVVDFINNMKQKNYEPVVVYLSNVVKNLKSIDKSIIQKILDFLSHEEQVNSKYKIPSDYTEIDFYLKPLIKLTPTKFILINKTLSSPNYYETLANHFRLEFKKDHKDIDIALGLQLELFLHKKLNEKGIRFHTGGYKVGKTEGECDLLIESDKSIILIELKKKPLTRKARSGIDVDILLDLVESILNAQIQAGRTEIILREKGSITLKNKKLGNSTIHLNDRSVERIALTQLEFGGFQDRIFVDQFLSSLLTHSFNPIDSSNKRVLDRFIRLSKKQKELVKQHDKLYELDELYKRNPFFNCWFLGLPQLLEIINLSLDSNSFHKILTNTKYITLGTHDWYYEFNYTNQLKDIKST